MVQVTIQMPDAPSGVSSKFYDKIEIHEGSGKSKTHQMQPHLSRDYKVTEETVEKISVTRYFEGTPPEGYQKFVNFTEIFFQDNLVKGATNITCKHISEYEVNVAFEGYSDLKFIGHYYDYNHAEVREDYECYRVTYPEVDLPVSNFEENFEEEDSMNENHPLLARVNSLK